jgi:hypothetical protein
MKGITRLPPAGGRSAPTEVEVRRMEEELFASHNGAVGINFSQVGEKNFVDADCDCVCTRIPATFAFVVCKHFSYVLLPDDGPCIKKYV